MNKELQQLLIEHPNARLEIYLMTLDPQDLRPHRKQRPIQAVRYIFDPVDSSEHIICFC